MRSWSEVNLQQTHVTRRTDISVIYGQLWLVDKRNVIGTCLYQTGVEIAFHMATSHQHTPHLVFFAVLCWIISLIGKHYRSPWSSSSLSCPSFKQDVPSIVAHVLHPYNKQLLMYMMDVRRVPTSDYLHAIINVYMMDVRRVPTSDYLPCNHQRVYDGRQKGANVWLSSMQSSTCIWWTSEGCQLLIIFHAIINMYMMDVRRVPTSDYLPCNHQRVYDGRQKGANVWLSSMQSSTCIWWTSDGCQLLIIFHAIINMYMMDVRWVPTSDYLPCNHQHVYDGRQTGANSWLSFMQSSTCIWWTSDGCQLLIIFHAIINVYMMDVRRVPTSDYLSCNHQHVYDGRQTGANFWLSSMQSSTCIWWTSDGCQLLIIFHAIINVYMMDVRRVPTSDYLPCNHQHVYDGRQTGANSWVSFMQSSTCIWWTSDGCQLLIIFHAIINMYMMDVRRVPTSDYLPCNHHVYDGRQAGANFWLSSMQSSTCIWWTSDGCQLLIIFHAIINVYMMDVRRVPTSDYLSCNHQHVYDGRQTGANFWLSFMQSSTCIWWTSDGCQLLIIFHAIINMYMMDVRRVPTPDYLSCNHQHVYDGRQTGANSWLSFMQSSTCIWWTSDGCQLLIIFHAIINMYMMDVRWVPTPDYLSCNHQHVYDGRQTGANSWLSFMQSSTCIWWTSEGCQLLIIFHAIINMYIMDVRRVPTSDYLSCNHQHVYHGRQKGANFWLSFMQSSTCISWTSEGCQLLIIFHAIINVYMMDVRRVPTSDYLSCNHQRVYDGRQTGANSWLSFMQSSTCIWWTSEGCQLLIIFHAIINMYMMDVRRVPTSDYLSCNHQRVYDGRQKGANFWLSFHAIINVYMMDVRRVSTSDYLSCNHQRVYDGRQKGANSWLSFMQSSTCIWWTSEGCQLLIIFHAIINVYMMDVRRVPTPDYLSCNHQRVYDGRQKGANSWLSFMQSSTCIWWTSDGCQLLIIFHAIINVYMMDVRRVPTPDYLSCNHQRVYDGRQTGANSWLSFMQSSTCIWWTSEGCQLLIIFHAIINMSHWHSTMSYFSPSTSMPSAATYTIFNLTFPANERCTCCMQADLTACRLILLHAGWSCCMQADLTACRLILLHVGWSCCMQAALAACRLILLHVGWSYCMQADLTACRLILLHAGWSYCMQADLAACRLILLHGGWSCCTCSMQADLTACRLILLHAGWSCCMQAALAACRLILLHAGWSYCMQADLAACRLILLHAGWSYCMQADLAAWRLILLHGGWSCCMQADLTACRLIFDPINHLWTHLLHAGWSSTQYTTCGPTLYTIALKRVSD